MKRIKALLTSHNVNVPNKTFNLGMNVIKVSLILFFSGVHDYEIKFYKIQIL